MNARDILSLAETTVNDLIKTATGANIHRRNNRATVIKGMISIYRVNNDKLVLDEIYKITMDTRRRCLSGPYSCPCQDRCDKIISNN